ncbi:uncharacterized protein LOC121881040 [Thunnus maccoyii]|uniref:uncharacterized protein LOC121881040 n=1 Tax=Thunnus maccoyii TaxID=8240 RepID=UPI001C4C4E2B|nr:uncharacterized protein LOC121881040 [Thunnus maccoyii]
MAQKGVQLDREAISCSICLDLLKDPVTIPCGHSYCMSCVKTHWNEEDERKIYSCPQCRQTFTPRPVLMKNTMLAALVEQLKKTGLQAAPADHCYAGPEDVACDVCTGRKLKALKSCLVCLVSYCEKHLQPHFESSKFKKHKLVDPSDKLQENICSHHDEVMKMFCRTDQQSICYLCSVEEHKGHDTVSAAAERTERQREIEVSRQQIQQRIQDRQKDVKLLQQEVKAVSRSADKAVKDSEKIFTELIRLLQKRSSDVKQQIRSQQATEVSRVKELQEKLEQEITELKRKDAELKQLSHTEDHIQFLHNYPSLSQLSASTYSSSINIRPLRYFEDVTAAVSELRDQLQDILREKWTNISLTGTEVDVLLSEAEPKTRAEFLKYSCEITLDTNTANTELLLSEGNRKAELTRQQQSYSSHPDRFTDWTQVLSRESLTGRCYWEVEWRGEGVCVAVAYKNIHRTGGLNECAFGFNDKSWMLYCDTNSYKFWFNSISTRVSGPGSSRVGVYLDHRAGILSFYRVSETMTLLHRVQTTFTQPLYAGFWIDYYGVTAELCTIKTRFVSVLDNKDALLAAVTLLKFKARWLREEERREALRTLLTTERRTFHRNDQDFIDGCKQHVTQYKTCQSGSTSQEVKLRQSLPLRAEMAQKGDQLDQETISCSICLDLLKDPVTIPCGHSYCMSCIKGFWNGEDQRKIYSCPQCRQTFTPRPVLMKNTMLADLVEQLKKSGLQAAPADHCYAGPEDVACDVCTGRKLKALKSCLVCLVSYCEKHLQPHFESSKFKKHKLVDPSEKLQENICSRHDEVMKMFCRTDQQSICYLCPVDEHKGHDTVSAAAERTERQRELEVSRQQIQQRIQDREKDVRLHQQEVKAVSRSADKAVEDSEKIFTELIRLIQKRSSDVKQQIRSQQDAEVSRVKELQEKLEQEITELKRKDAELKQLSHTEDHNQFLHNYPSLSQLSASTDSSSINIRPLRYFEDVTAAVSELRDQLQDILREKWTNISLTVTEVDVLVSETEPKTRAEFLKYSREITLDPNTAYTYLLLSEGNRRAELTRQQQSYYSHPDRFTDYWQVLSRESLTGRCYWEVEWRGREVHVAVAYKNISRAGSSYECIFGFNDKSWALYYDTNSYTFLFNSISTPVSGPGSSRVGVYLDHRAGILSFYRVSETMTLLHRVQTTFTQPLYAGLWLGSGTTAEFCKLK